MLTLCVKLRIYSHSSVTLRCLPTSVKSHSKRNELNTIAIHKPLSICVLFVFSLGKQILIACSLLFFASSKPTILFTLQRKPYLEIYCQFSYGFLATCVYNTIVIIACCYFAFRARQVPSNYNESKFIAISVYSTVIVCLAAVPVYSTAIDVAQKILTLIVALLFNTYLTLACLYLPKIYAIHFAGEEAQQTWRTQFESSAAANERPATEMTQAPAKTTTTS